jgi:TolA-binding protein
MRENKKVSVWLYAVILFTSAFIVLLFAGYSQIRLNQNLSEYKSQVFYTESEKNEYLRNFASAQEMNEELNKEISQLKEENDDLKKRIKDLADEKYALQDVLLKNKEAADNLSIVIGIYLDGDVIGAAEQLKNVDVTVLDELTAKTFKTFEKKVTAEAGNQLFDEGFSLYNRAKYYEAAEKLLLSFQYAPKEGFSDKCLYYLAYAELRAGKKSEALEHMKRLVSEYPQSNYFRRAKQFVNRYE